MSHRMHTAIALWLLLPIPSRADALHDWNVKANELVVASRVSPPAAFRATAIVQTAVYEAVNAVTGRYPVHDLRLRAASGASIDAAVAAANRVALSQLLVGQQAAIDDVYRAALGRIPDGPGKLQGIALGEKAAAGVYAQRGDDGVGAAESIDP
jgi:hypothetical protein